MTNRRADDIGMALVRALRPEADVERNARVERAIDNQGNPIMDNVVLVAGGPGGTVIVTWAAIQGDPEDNTALAAALDALESQITESSHTHANKAVLDGIDAAFTVLHENVLSSVANNAVRVTHDDASGWAFVVDEDDMTSDDDTKLPTQQSVKAYVDNSAGDGHTHSNKTILDGIDAAFTVLHESVLNSVANNAVRIGDTDASGWDWVVDEDDMDSDSDELIPTQQSVKAYVDANAGDGHTHANKATLDLIEEAFLSIHLSTLQGLVNHANNTSNPHSVTAAQVGAAAASHTHNASAITAGTINPARLPNGSTALGSAVSTTSTSNQTVTALNISAAANATYQITYVVQCGCDGAGGVRVGVNAPSGSSVSYTTHGSVGAASGADWTGELSTGAGPGTKGWGQNAVVGGSTPTGAATITAIVHTGGSSGNISLQYRANTSGQTSIIGTGTKVSWVRTG